MDLPCKGNGTDDTQFRHHFFDPKRDHCVTVPLQGSCNSLNRDPGRRSETRLPLGWYPYPLRGKDGCQLQNEDGSDELLTVRTISPTAARSTVLPEFD